MKRSSFKYDHNLFEKAKRSNLEFYDSILDENLELDPRALLEELKYLIGQYNLKTTVLDGINGLEELKVNSYENDIYREGVFRSIDEFRFSLRSQTRNAWRYFPKQLFDNENQSKQFIWYSRIKYLSLLRNYDRPARRKLRMKMNVGRDDVLTLDHNELMRIDLFTKINFQESSIENETVGLLKKLRLSTFLIFKHEDQIIAIRKPIIRSFKNENEEFNDIILHNDKGPALLFPDGSSLSFYNGEPISNWIWNEEDSRLKARRIARIHNTELRRVAIEYMGIDKFLSYFESRVIDQEGDYELVLFRFEIDSLCPYLIMKNPSTGEKHIEGIPPNKFTVKEALQWRMGLKVFEEPSFRS